MLKNILKINGVQEVTISEQKSIEGGDPPFFPTCAGPGTGGVTTVGYAAVCADFPAGTPCTIFDSGNHGSGCPAECAGGPTFWML